jgi:hypothetical protein
MGGGDASFIESYDILPVAFVSSTAIAFPSLPVNDCEFSHDIGPGFYIYAV